MAQNRRLKLHECLQELIGVRSDGKPNVYFQPPSKTRLNYPCLIYGRTDVRTQRADNKVYSATTAYLVTLIDENPDSELNEKLIQLPMCSFDRHFTSDNLNHDVYKLFY